MCVASADGGSHRHSRDGLAVPGRLEVGLLGSIEAFSAEGPLALAGQKLKAIVAMLALAAPHTVSDDRLIDELWDEEHPTNPTNALQAQISQLRRVLGRDALERRGQGYGLVLDADDVDAIRLERLVRAGRTAIKEGDHHAAASHYEAALSLVRGPPLDDLGGFRFARHAASRLDELVFAAHEGLVDVQLATGGHAEVIPSLTGLVSAHPLRERFHAQLILALYRCGRQGDALRAYQHARDLLVEELGVDPGPELQALERAVLAQDATLDRAVSGAHECAERAGTDDRHAGTSVAPGPATTRRARRRAARFARRFRGSWHRTWSIGAAERRTRNR